MTVPVCQEGSLQVLIQEKTIEFTATVHMNRQWSLQLETVDLPGEYRHRVSGQNHGSLVDSESPVKSHARRRQPRICHVGCWSHTETGAVKSRAGFLNYDRPIFCVCSVGVIR